jgi:hypothetical protein
MHTVDGGKSRRMRLAEYVTRMERMNISCVYNFRLKTVKERAVWETQLQEKERHRLKRFVRVWNVLSGSE